MELSRQMLLLAAENYGSYYLHITKIQQEEAQKAVFHCLAI